MDLGAWVIVAIVIGAIIFNVAYAKGWIGTGSGGRLDGLAVKLASLVSGVKGEVVLSYAGRQAIRTVMLFVMVCLEALPDGDQKDKCKQGARDIDAAFFDPPHQAPATSSTPARTIS